MKKVILFTALVLGLATSVNAQWRVGIEAGANVSGYSSPKPKNITENKGVGIGYQVGASAEYEFRNHLVLGSGLYFIHTVSSQSLTGRNKQLFAPKAVINLDQLMLPLHLGYRFTLNDNLKLTPYVGGYFSYNISAGSAKFDIIENGKVNHTQWIPQNGYSGTYTWEDEEGNTYSNGDKVEGLVHHLSYGLLAGLSLEIHRHYTVSLQYTQAFNNLQNSNRLHGYGLMLSVGYKF